MNLPRDREAHAPQAPVTVSVAETEALARARVEQARIDILLDHPYFATALLRMPMLGTADTAFAAPLATDGRRIVFRHDLIAALPRPRVRMLLMHALAHTLLRHPERGSGRSWAEWSLACDIAVQFVFESAGIVPMQPWSAGMESKRSASAERLYELLANGDRWKQDWLPGYEPPGDGLLAHEPQGDAPPEHRAFHASFLRASAAEEPLGALELDGLARAFATDVGKLVARAGRKPGEASCDIEAADRATLPWRTTLARFLNEPIGRTWSLARPNRKHLWRGLYLPGAVDIEGGRFVIAIDTSGSMSAEDLGCVLAEIDAIRRTCSCEVTVLQFDATLHAKAEFTQWGDRDESVGSTRIMRFWGRGGTDIRIPFAWVEDERRNGRRVSALIVCTDGFGPLPEQAPAGLPVLFLLTPIHQAPDFGEQIVLPKGIAKP
ncbi:MAG: DUF2201 family putative metallopeptidase [Planctomycetota bacterium]